MILGAHQPHFLPWLGYFHKILCSDLFVLVDHVQFERQNFQNRNRIKTRSGPRWLVVPVRQRSRSETILEKRIADVPDGPSWWGERLFRTLEHAYRRAPHFLRHREFFRDTLTTRWQRLVSLNEHCLRYLLEQLAIDTPIVRSSELPSVCGAKTEMILGLCRCCGADSYLSGSGASRRYLDVALLRRNGVEVRWQQLELPAYPQLEPPAGFVPRLSVVDLLFNCGEQSAEIIRRCAPTGPPAGRDRPGGRPSASLMEGAGR